MPTQSIYGFLKVNNDYFLRQRLPVDLCNGEELCFLCGTDWILKYYLDELRLQRVNVTVKLHLMAAFIDLKVSVFALELSWWQYTYDAIVYRIMPAIENLAPMTEINPGKVNYIFSECLWRWYYITSFFLLDVIHYLLNLFFKSLVYRSEIARGSSRESVSLLYLKKKEDPSFKTFWFFKTFKKRIKQTTGKTQNKESSKTVSCWRKRLRTWATAHVSDCARECLARSSIQEHCRRRLLIYVKTYDMKDILTKFRIIQLPWLYITVVYVMLFSRVLIKIVIYRLELQLRYIATAIPVQNHITELVWAFVLCPVETSCSRKVDRVVIGVVRYGYSTYRTDRFGIEFKRFMLPRDRLYSLLRALLLRRSCLWTQGSISR
jgi:hypothetical protein